MSDDKKPMPADGSGTSADMADDNGELASRRAAHSDGSANPGESGGGAYPNPHTGKEGSDDGPGKLMGHGGQSEMAYHGHGQLGEDDGEGRTYNAPAEDDYSAADRRVAFTLSSVTRAFSARASSIAWPWTSLLK